MPFDKMMRQCVALDLFAKDVSKPGRTPEELSVLIDIYFHTHRNDTQLLKLFQSVLEIEAKKLNENQADA